MGIIVNHKYLFSKIKSNKNYKRVNTLVTYTTHTLFKYMYYF